MKRKGFSKIMSIVMALLMALSTLTLLPVTALAEETVTVGTADELLAVVTEINNDANKFSGKTVQLTADIDLTGKTWVQIKEFQGTLDGNGYSITNIAISGTAVNWLGFFHTMNGATVKNLRITGALTQLGTSHKQYIGFLASVAKGNNLIQNVSIEGSVTAAGTDAGRCHAGFISMVTAGTTSIIGCESNVSVTGYQINAGFVGGTFYGTTLNLVDCVFTGNLSQSPGTETCAFVGRVSGDVNMTRCVKLGNSYDNAGQWRGALVYLDAKDSQTNATVYCTQEGYVAPTVTLKDCYITADVEDITVVAAHGSRGNGQFNVSISYNDVQTYSYNATADASKDIYTETKGQIKVLTAQNFETVYPGLKDWVVTTETVNYGKDTEKLISRVTPRGIIEMEQKVNAAAFGSDKYVQLKANANDPTATDIRFVTNIKSADYDTVGYLVSLDGNAVLVVNNAEIAATATNTVYTSIIADGTPVAPDEAGTYWLALGINGVPASAKDTTIYVRPYAIKDGNVTLGTVASFTLNSVNQ